MVSKCGKRVKTINAQDLPDAVHKTVVISDADMVFMSVNIADGIEHKMEMQIVCILVKRISDLVFFSE